VIVMKGLLHPNKFNGWKPFQWKSLQLELEINMVLPFNTQP
jgi:hypothetical protein